MATIINISHDQGNVGQSIDDLTYRLPTPKTTSNPTHAYINTAFSFLVGDNHGPYKYYDDNDEVDIPYPGKGQDTSSRDTGTDLNIWQEKVDSHSFSDQSETLTLKERLKSARTLKIFLLTCLALVIITALVFGLVYKFVMQAKPAPEPVPGLIFSGTSVIRNTWDENMLRENSPEFKSISGEFIENIDSIIEGSNFSAFYSYTQVSRLSPGSIIVDFQIIYVEPPPGDDEGRKKLPKAGELEVHIQNELDVRYSQNLLRWPVENLKLTESGTPTSTASPIFTTPTLPRTTPAPVTCVDLTEGRCMNGEYSKTGFPNVYGHTGSSDELTSGLNDLLELNNHGCYAHTTVFACTSVYPQCTAVGKLISPCLSFCEAFVESCRFPIRCHSGFLDDDDPSVCVLPPNYQSDNKVIPPGTCPSNLFRCGNENCIEKSLECNNVDDCGDLSDELNCDNTQVSAIDCDFEDGNTCGYTQHLSNHYNWTVHDSSATSVGTGPAADHTKRDGSGSYLLADASGRYWRDVAQLKSPLVDMEALQCLRFYYHMYGDNVRSLKVLLQKDGSGDVEEVWMRASDQGNKWKYGFVTIESGSYRVIFEAERGESFRGDIALDDITLRPRACPSSVTACTSDEYACSNGNCVPTESVCNGEDDCLDFTDERDCTCSRQQFQCQMGMCIQGFRRCDTIQDCPDGSDEVNCVCDLGQMRCNDNNDQTCIMSEWLCDGERDCYGGEDEENCDLCSATEWQCKDLTCIDAGLHCNGSPDCPDGSDEILCIKESDQHIIEVMNGNSWHKLCAENYDDSLDGQICTALGKRPVAIRSALPAAEVSPLSYVRVKSGVVDGNLLSHFERVSSCAGDQAIALACNDPRCGEATLQSPASFITNGEQAVPGRWPWVVGLLYNLVLTCGGTLINQNHVITAAHCVDRSSDPGNYRILLGSIFITKEDTNRKVVQVKSIRRHENYQNFYWGNDIAVLTLEDPGVTYNDFIRPLCLPEEEGEEAFPFSSVCYTAGWGYVDYEEGKTVDTMQEGKVRLLDAELCKLGHPNYADDMLCAGYESGFIANCKGDSGGPLMCADPHGRWKLVGVFSSIPKGCNVPQTPPLYMRVQHYLSWIRDGLECAFRCTNSKCLVDTALICNGQDDCGDNSDEVLNCFPSISCTFENEYMCGYQNLPDLRFNVWTRERISGTVNHGPTVDHTVGDTTGSFLFAGKTKAVILAPMYRRPSPHCLRFWYHRFGVDVGRFYAWLLPWDVTSTLAYDDIVSDRTVLVQVVSIDSDISDSWIQVSFDIPAGNFRIGFETLSQLNQYPFVAIDDVELLPGTCASSSSACGTGMGPCDTNGCYQATQRCDYVPDCPGDYGDETGCLTSRYACDFEVFGNCRFQQAKHDDLDWKILSPGPSPFNSPTTDHSTGTNSGYFLYFPTHIGYPGERATLVLPIFEQDDESCLEFYYNMVSTGALMISYQNDRDGVVEALLRNGVSNQQWVHVEVPIPRGVYTLAISGTIGTTGITQSVPAENYIAVDDIVLARKPCANPACRPDQGACANGDCIDLSHFCDGGFDCPGNDDEYNCECRPGEILCEGICRDYQQVCYGIHSCTDVTTLNCSCNRVSYQCSDGTCRDASTWCNRQNDCPDGGDELPGCVCREDQFTCNDGQCILGLFYCDGQQTNCDDGSDELDGCTCESNWRFRCDNDRCIERDGLCNTKNDCFDFSDEKNCGPCSDDQFLCTSIGMCIPKSERCDGTLHCPAGEDETEECKNIPCEEGNFKCTDGQCIPQEYVCNLFVNCVDASDERDCTCLSGERQCDNGICLPSNKFCDSNNDCNDWSDETNCVCRPDQFTCASGRCIGIERRCDDVDDCLDFSDEESCETVPGGIKNCLNGDFRCSDGSDCIPNDVICDGYPDCRDQSDEANCGDSCANSFTCANDRSVCVPLIDRCNGVLECTDGSDELDCLLQGTENELDGVLMKRGMNTGNPLPVCAADWKEEWSTSVCKQLGHGPDLATDTAIVMTNQYFTVKAGASGEYSHDVLQYSFICPEYKVLKITCKERSCGNRLLPAGPASFIIGGNTAADGAWPWMAAIYYLDQFICGATLVDSQWVVSASHCFDNKLLILYRTHLISVKVGTKDLTQTGSPAQKISAAEIILHPDFYSSVTQFRYNDIALVRLSQSVQFGDYVQPVCLPDPDRLELSPRTKLCFATGWGNTDDDGRADVVTNLREVHMKQYLDEGCWLKWGDSINSTTHLCAGYSSGRSTTCFGDSGGPLVCKERNSAAHWSLEGVISMGSQFCRVNRPNVFSEVKHFTPWILKTITEKSIG